MGCRLASILPGLEDSLSKRGRTDVSRYLRRCQSVNVRGLNDAERWHKRGVRPAVGALGASGLKRALPRLHMARSELLTMIARVQRGLPSIVCRHRTDAARESCQQQYAARQMAEIAGSLRRPQQAAALHYTRYVTLSTLAIAKAYSICACKSVASFSQKI